MSRSTHTDAGDRRQPVTGVFVLQKPMSEISAVVLAGGKGSRLGRDKSFLVLDGKPLIARTVERLAELSDDIIVVTNRPEPYRALGLPARLVPDETPGVGALMGLYSGLKAATHPFAAVVACDMPFLSLALLRYMHSLTEGYDIVVPRLGRFQEPLHAVYSKLCLPFIERRLRQGSRRIVSFFPDVRVRHVEEPALKQHDPQHRSFLNVNPPEDWERVQRMLEPGNEV